MNWDNINLMTGLATYRIMGVLLFLILIFLIKQWLLLGLIFGLYQIIRSIINARLGYDPHVFKINEIFFTIIYILLYLLAHTFKIFVFYEPFIVKVQLIHFFVPLGVLVLIHRLIWTYYSWKSKQHDTNNNLTGG